MKLIFFKKTFTCIMFLALSFSLFALDANVMAPLKIDLTDYEIVSDFRHQLKDCKGVGIKAVSVDVWWGMVEGKASGTFDWSYYDYVFKMIIEAGLQIQPIMSFHACGSNVGDTVKIPIPEWIWGIAGSGAKYVGEQNDPGNSEVVSVWATNYGNVLQEYRIFMEAFQKHFAGYAHNIQAINISCGPSGELRYPSYDSYTDRSGKSWGRGYPTRGYLQCYSEEAKKFFRNAMTTKYGTISKLNAAWGTSLASFTDVNPPKDGDGFFQINNPKAYINAQYGKDFIRWYNGELVRHCGEMLSIACEAFSKGEFSNIDLEIKIPGIHWEMSDPYMPRSAEVCAGLLDNSFYIWHRVSPPGGSEYLPILNMVKSFDNEHGRRVIVYFTCLEMANGDLYSWPYSMPSALVFWIGNQADKIGLIIKGENALAPNSGATWDDFWKNIKNVILHSTYKGTTFLRMEDVSRGKQHYYLKVLLADGY